MFITVYTGVTTFSVQLSAEWVWWKLISMSTLKCLLLIFQLSCWHTNPECSEMRMEWWTHGTADVWGSVNSSVISPVFSHTMCFYVPLFARWFNKKIKQLRNIYVQLQSFIFNWRHITLSLCGKSIKKNVSFLKYTPLFSIIIFLFIFSSIGAQSDYVIIQL